jgi:VCBS repeat-containing protein
MLQTQTYQGLDAGDSNITDVFTYIVSDGTATSTATLTINVIASQDVTARNDTGTVNEDATLTVSDGDDTSTVAGASYVDSISTHSLGNASATQPQDVKFNNDGTKMFVVDDGSNAIREYHLSTGYDISTASYDSILQINSQDTSPRAIAFNNDGTKMFVVGWMGQDINEYHLTTGFDISTASYDSNFSISSQENGPNGLAFNSDGTKMFVSGDGTGDAVNEYTLSTGFDVSTASYDSKFSTLSQDTSSQGLAFSNDGKKMFVAGDTGNDINEYTLSTGFDVSTASFVGSFDVSSQGTQPTGITFNNDGTKMFITDSSGNLGSHSVDEYTLTTPFSLVDVSGEHSGDVINTSSTDNYDTDPDSDTLTVTAIRTGSSEGSGTDGSIGSALTGTYGQLTIAANGSYTYVANQDAADALDPGDVVTDTFNYTVSDGQGETDIAVLTITVVGINDTPVADDETNSVNEDAAITVTDGTTDVLHGDTDVDSGDTLTVTQIAVTGGSASSVAGSSTYNSNGTSITSTHGTLVIGADGTYTYTADQSAADDLDAGDTATDSFTYTVSDGTATDTATLIITVTGINDVPTAADKTVTTNEDTAYVFSASDFGYTDVDDHDSLVSVKITGLENAGALQYNNGSAWVDVTANQVITATDIGNNKLRFNPAANENGSPYTTFDFTVNDGDADSASANTITVNVTAVNDAPTAADNTVTTIENTNYVFSTSDFNFSDVDGDSLDNISITSTVDNGALQYYNGSTWVDITGGNSSFAAWIIPLGRLRFTPDANENGTSYTSFDFQVSDGTVDSGTYTMTVNVTPANNAPSATNDTDAVNEDATITESSGSELLVADDSDADSDTLTVTQIKVTGGSNSSVAGSSTYNSNFTSVTGTYGTLKVGADGSYTYVADRSAADDLDASDTATDSFTYTVSDGTDTDTATLIITVTGINDAPGCR